MSFNGPALSFDDEGSVLFDGEKFIVNDPSKVPDNFNSGGRPVVGLPEDHPAQQQNQQTSTYVPPPVIFLAFDKHKAEEHVEHVIKTRESARNVQSQSDVQVFPVIPADLASDVALEIVSEEPVAREDWRDSSPLTPGQAQEVDHLLTVETDSLAREVLITLKRDGIPPRSEWNDFMAQYALFSWDTESDAQAWATLALIAESDWDEATAYADEDHVEAVAQDRANDWIEGLTIIHAKTGDILLDVTGVERADGSQYVGLQDYEVEALKGLPLIFVHNHPNDTGASDDDLKSAFDAGAKLLTVITRDGREQVFIRGRDRMVEVRDGKASYEIGPGKLDEALWLQAESQAQARKYLDDSPEYVFLQDDLSQLVSEIHVPEGMTREQAVELFRDYINYDAYKGYPEVQTHTEKYLIPVWNKMWTADPSKGHDYGTLVELSPIILEQAKLWNHPDSGMSDIEVALWMIANLHQEARLRRTGGHVILPSGHMIFPGLPGFLQDPFGWLEDKLGDLAVFRNPSLGPANIRPSVGDEVLKEKLYLPMPNRPVEEISDDQLDSNQLDELNSLREEWRGASHYAGPFGHRFRVLFLSDNENAIKLMAINFYRGVERLVRLELPPTLFTLSAWQSQGVPERDTLVNSVEKKALNARKHAAQTSLYLNAITHHEESFGMDISAEEWKTIQIFEDKDFEAMLRYLLKDSQ